MKDSPALGGLRAVWHRPAFGLAEMAWRWAFGLAACGLLGATVIEYLNSLAVSPLDLLLLRSRHPLLIGRALNHILSGSGTRLLNATLVLLPALALAWIVLASLGRAATLKALLEYFGGRAAATWRLRSLMGLNFLRTALALAAFLGLLGAAILAGFASPEDQPRPGLVFLVLAFLGLLVWTAWSLLNWFLSTASIFVVRDAQDTFGALGATVLLCRDYFGPLFVAGSWFALARLVTFAAATTAACFPLALARTLPRGITMSALLVITLLYFAIVDFLYVARLAAYLRIVDDSRQPVSVAPTQPLYDPDDLILSDLQAALGPGN